MPVYYLPASETKYMKRTCESLGVSFSDYLLSTGFTSAKALASANPKWTAFGMVGLILEWYDEIMSKQRDVQSV